MTIEEKITFEPDPVWSDRYEKEREQILNRSGEGILDIFHVGSTAIPDLPGKTALDVIVVFADYDSMRTTADTLGQGSYEFGHEGSDCIVLLREADDHAVFVKMHIQDDEKVRSQLVFRDYLRENSEARREYEQVKREAAAEHLHDQDTYTEAKSEVVRSLLKQAQKQGYAENLPDFV